MKSQIPEKLADLFEAAAAARKNSYSPYSHYAVGCAIRMEDGKIFSGCNVENSSYGATICAERTAVLSAVTAGSKKIRELLLITQNSPPAPPCGVCLQVIREFGEEKTPIHLSNPAGELRTVEFRELLPQAFLTDHLFKN